MLKLKICGLTDPQNIKDVIALSPDMLGFIFHSASPRNFTGGLVPDLPTNIEKVGVFVNSEPVFIERMIERHHLTSIQLYHEDLKPFQMLRKKVKIIKALPLANERDVHKTRLHTEYCDLFLFDTKGEKIGGNGIKFNWNVLDSYTGSTPFFLSGGITTTDVPLVKKIIHKKMVGLDINSKFEISPGIKNIDLIKQFKNDLNENT